MTSTDRTRLTTLLGALAAVLGLGLVAAGPARAVTELTDAQAAGRLSAVGITRSWSGGCTTRSVSTCTSCEQINQATVDGVKTDKGVSGCAVNITGGTEVGHASGTYSHDNGYNGSKVDVARSIGNDNDITSHDNFIGLRGDGYPQYQAASGNVYVNEGSHWDITY